MEAIAFLLVFKSDVMFVCFFLFWSASVYCSLSVSSIFGCYMLPRHPSSICLIVYLFFICAFLFWIYFKY